MKDETRRAVKLTVSSSGTWNESLEAMISKLTTSMAGDKDEIIRNLVESIMIKDLILETVCNMSLEKQHEIVDIVYDQIQKMEKKQD